MQVRADSKWTHWIEEQPSASFMNRVTEHRDSLAKIVSVVLNSELENDKYLSRLTDNQLLPYSTVIANEIIQTDFPELIEALELQAIDLEQQVEPIDQPDDLVFLDELPAGLSTDKTD